MRLAVFLGIAKLGAAERRWRGLDPARVVLRLDDVVEWLRRLVLLDGKETQPRLRTRGGMSSSALNISAIENSMLLWPLHSQTSPASRLLSVTDEFVPASRRTTLKGCSDALIAGSTSLNDLSAEAFKKAVSPVDAVAVTCTPAAEAHPVNEGAAAGTTMPEVRCFGSVRPLAHRAHPAQPAERQAAGHVMAPGHHAPHAASAAAAWRSSRQSGPPPLVIFCRQNA